MLMDVMGAFAIMSIGLLLFAMGSVQLSKLFQETYATASVDALRLDSLGLELRRDERASLAAFAGSGDLTLDSDTFTGAAFPTQVDGTSWGAGPAFLASLTTFYAQSGRTLAVIPNTGIEQNSWLLFLGPAGRVTAYYRFHNLQSTTGDGGAFVSTSVERYVLVNASDPALTLVEQVSLDVPGRTLANLAAGNGHAFAVEESDPRDVVASLPSAYLAGQHLYDSDKLWLEAREPAPRTFTLRPGFQP